MTPIDAMRLLLPVLKEDIDGAPEDRTKVYAKGDGYELTFEDLAEIIAAIEKG